MNTRVCAVITARTLQEQYAMIKKAERTGADLIEIRMDFLRGNCEVDKLRDFTTLPLIATNRPKREKGLFEGSENQRIDSLYRAANAGFDFVDIELMTEGIVNIVRDIGVKTIVSFHDFSSTPDVSIIKEIFKREVAVGAEICKIVTMANDMRDNLTCLRFVNETSKTGKVVCFCMGELGLLSRIISPLVGSSFTYTSVERGRKSAPGQITVEETHLIYKLLGI